MLCVKQLGKRINIFRDWSARMPRLSARLFILLFRVRTNQDGPKNTNMFVRYKFYSARMYFYSARMSGLFREVDFWLATPLPGCRVFSRAALALEVLLLLNF